MNSPCIGLVAPAKRIDRQLVDEAIQNCRSKGYEVLDFTPTQASHSYLAGSDHERAKRFMQCWRDPRVHIVWSLAGGYGCARLFQFLDFQQLIENPKLLVGMSDVTALHLVFQKKGLKSILGPNFQFVFGSQAHANNLPFFHALLQHEKLQIDFKEAKILSAGAVSGVLTGGNLTMIGSLMGTPWEIDTRDKILLLEDVNEEPYRIDRLLCQLQLAGKLDHLKGVILASWVGCEPKISGQGLTLDEVFHKYFADQSYPVIWGFPSGHLPFQVSLPLGNLCLLDTYRLQLVFDKK